MSRTALEARAAPGPGGPPPGAGVPPPASRVLEVIETGPLATVQDLGRPGHAALGVGSAGAADRQALRLGNRAVGNPEGAAAVEVTFGGLRVRLHGGAFATVTGAPAPVTVDGRAEAPYTVFYVPDGAEVRLAAPPSGLRSYLAVRGGLAVPLVLGSRSTDTLASLGPARLVPGAALPLGDPPGLAPLLDVLPVAPPPPAAAEVPLRAVPGPRDDWFTAEALHRLFTGTYEVTSEIDRVGMRLDGPRLARAEHRELPSEGTVTGALQVPPSGLPVLFLADHPLTGGYPVIAVVAAADVGRAAQARPGQRLRFRPQPARRLPAPSPPSPRSPASTEPPHRTSDHEEVTR